MQASKEAIRKLWRNDEGQDLVEYALIAGLISLICWAAIQTAGVSISGVWSTVNSAITAASTAA